MQCICTDKGMKYTYMGIKYTYTGCCNKVHNGAVRCESHIFDGVQYKYRGVYIIQCRMQYAVQTHVGGLREGVW